MEDGSHCSAVEGGLCSRLIPIEADRCEALHHLRDAADVAVAPLYWIQHVAVDRHVLGLVDGGSKQLEATLDLLGFRPQIFCCPFSVADAGFRKGEISWECAGLLTLFRCICSILRFSNVIVQYADVTDWLERS